MFNKERKIVQKKWREVTLELVNSGVTKTTVDAMQKLHEAISYTCQYCAQGKKMNKTTLRIICLVKRLLADKRRFEAIKCIDYIIAAHSVSLQKVDEDIKTGVMAHLMQMCSLYQIMMTKKLESNPFAPGETIGEANESN